MLMFRMEIYCSPVDLYYTETSTRLCLYITYYHYDKLEYIYKMYNENKLYYFTESYSEDKQG